LKDDAMSESGGEFNNLGAGGGAEPSMEEIQASIRRILLEEEEGQNAPEDEQDDDVLQLDSSMLAAPPPPEAPGAGTDDMNGQASYSGQTMLPPERELNIYQPPSAASGSAHNQEPEKEDFMENNVQIPKGLVGDEASNSIANTIGSLVHSISTERAVAVSRGGITIEDLVREEIKPVLKAWLDTQLPSLVERVVRAEIKRVIDRT
jgi:cell pole-organizing protein PopZ